MSSEWLDPTLWQFCVHLYSRACLHSPLIPMQIALPACWSERADVCRVNTYRAKHYSARNDSKIGPAANCHEWESSAARGDQLGAGRAVGQRVGGLALQEGKEGKSEIQL